MKKWSEGDIFLLKKLWKETFKKDLIRIFPDRTWKSLNRKAESLKIKRIRLPYVDNDYIGRNYPYLKIESWIDGEMLSDGHVDSGGRYCHTTKYSSYANFLKMKFKAIEISVRIYDNEYLDKRTNKVYKRKLLKTRCFFKTYRERWYRDKKKIVPDDLVIDDLSFLHWILGDGTVDKNGYSFSLATMGFDNCDVVRLKEKLLDYGIDSSIHKNNNIGVLKTKKSVFTLSALLNNVKYPDCYNYKFDRLNLWVNKFRG